MPAISQSCGWSVSTACSRGCALVMTLACLSILGACERAPEPTPTTAQTLSPQGHTTRTPIRENGLYRSQNTSPFSVTTDRSDKTPGVYTPQPASKERRELMDAVRNATREELGTHAVFVAHNLRSNGRWAFAQLDPQRPDGSTIQPAQTPVHQRAGTTQLDGLRIDVIWKKQSSRWQIHAYRIGATDVWWLSHCTEGYPELLPGCS